MPASHVATTASDELAAVRRASRATGVAALVTMLLVFVPIVAASGQEPWTNYIWLLPYGLFWAWVVIVGVLLIRRSSTAGRMAS